MTLAELLPTIHKFSRGEKLHLIQLLAADVASEDSSSEHVVPPSYPIWSPYNATDGAAALLKLLADEKAAS